MASLTGQTIASTYDSLLKVSDNGPLTSTYKEIQDGFGNGSGLYLGTGGNVGIGTASPGSKLDLVVSGSGTTLDGYNVANGAVGGIFKLTGASYSYRALGANMLWAGGDGANTYIGTSTNHYLALGTNAFEYMRIATNGNLGIGTTSPAAKLHLTGGNELLRLQSDNGYIQWFDNANLSALGYIGANSSAYNIIAQSGSAPLILGTNSTERMRITSGGNVGIGTTSPSYTLHVNGSVAGTSAYVNLSDERYKKDIKPIENALDKILSLKGITFNWDKSNTDMNLDDANHIGLIAQEVEKVLPQAVTTGTDENMIKSVAYTDIVPVLIEAIKELTEKVNQLENK